jgi:pimeloyl-ACP methyl ester carboxylesterase
VAAHTGPTTLLDSTDGVGVAVHDLGGPDGAPVVLIVHATGFNAGAYRPFAARLAVRHRVVAIDVRGHGHARTPDGIDFRWADIADDVVAVLDSGELPDGPVHGVGHSMGGACLVLAAQRRPGAFRSLWLFEPVIPPPGSMPGGPGPNPMAEAAARRRPTFPSLEAAVENYASKPPLSAFHPDALRGYVEGGFEPLQDGSFTLRCRPEWEAAIFRMGGGNPAWDALPEVEVPVTVATGEDVGVGVAGFARPVAERLPRGRLAEYPHLGHFGPLQDPDGLAADVERWLAGG